MGGVLFLELAFRLAGLGLGSFLLFSFAWGGSFFWVGGGSRCGRGDGLRIRKLFPRRQGGTFGGGAGFVEVVLVIPRIRGEVTGTDVEDGGGHGADEVNIVANEDQGALVLAEGGDEGIDGADIQMGGRFIHQEKVGRVEQEFDEGEAGFFTTAENADRFKNIVPTKQERAQDRACRLFADGVGGVENGFENLMAHIERIAAVLGKVTDPDVVAEESLSRLDGKGAPQKFEKGGFPRTVRADENGPLAALGLEVEIPIDGKIAGAVGIGVGVGDLFERDDAETTADGLGKGEFNGAGSRDGGLDFLHPIDLFQFALSLRGFAGFGAKAISELLEGGDLLLLIFVSGEVLLFPRSFFDDVLVVVPAVAVQFGLRDFDNRSDQLVEKLAIVGDHENGAGVVAQILLKPNKGFEVKMVGRFVQKKEIGLLHEEAGEVGAHDPTAAEGFGFAGEVGIPKSEAAENLFGAGFELPAAEFGEGVDGLVILGVFQSTGGFMALDRLLDAGHFG